MWGKKKPDCCTCDYLKEILRELKRINKKLTPPRAVKLNLRAGTPVPNKES